jgi:hypothetical protein
MHIAQYLGKTLNLLVFLPVLVEKNCIELRFAQIVSKKTDEKMRGWSWAF